LFYDALKNAHGLAHDPFKQLVTPRPIGWISTVDAQGVVNLAPYSFFNAVSDNPHYVFFSSLGPKDSQRNAEATGEFVCSLATWDLRDQMNATSASVGPEVDEFEVAGLTPAPSRLVKPPRVAESPVALECKYFKSVELPPDCGRGIYTMVIGRVVGIHIDDDAIVDGKVDMKKLRPIARLGYMDYTVVDEIFSLQRPQ
jgi:flavin reductase (DIM6/NTAB) family NADH-FMN oxidoreductase RutF